MDEREGARTGGAGEVLLDAPLRPPPVDPGAAGGGRSGGAVGAAAGFVAAAGAGSGLAAGGGLRVAPATASRYLPPVAATIDTERAVAHLRGADTVMDMVIEAVGPPQLREPSPTAFQALARSIIFQQLSGKAASTILGRFVALFREGATAEDAVSGFFPEPGAGARARRRGDARGGRLPAEGGIAARPGGALRRGEGSASSASGSGATRRSSSTCCRCAASGAGRRRCS